MQIKNRQQILAAVAISAVALFAGDKLVISPLTNAWKARAARIVELRQWVADGKGLLDREETVRSRWEQMQSRTLTNNPSAAEQQVWTAVERWAQDSRASIAVITPQWKQDAEDYKTYECRVDAKGDLRSISKFLYDAETERLALRLESVELGASDKLGQSITLGLQFSGLVLTSQKK